MYSLLTFKPLHDFSLEISKNVKNPVVNYPGREKLDAGKVVERKDFKQEIG